MLLNDIKTTEYDDLIRNALEEDVDERGDITSSATIPVNQSSKFELLIKEEGVICGLELAARTFHLIDEDIKFFTSFEDGNLLSGEKELTIVSIEGNTSSILRGERVALNLLAHLSGVATLTNKFVEKIKDTNTILLDTRKTTPGLRSLEKYAVKVGGGENHRMSLSDRFLIKDNHIANAGGVKNAIISCKDYLNSQKLIAKSQEPTLIEVEVSNKKELEEAISASPDIIMFDNWSVDDLNRALKTVPQNIKTEASGMINLNTIRDYALTGVDYISTSYMVKNAKWIDFSLEAV